MKIIFLFLDGVGLGDHTPLQNPFLSAKTPFLDSLFQGKKLCKDIDSFQNEVVSVYGLDASVGIPGIPQSATGQAMLLTGTNIPQHLGYHYGPKPNSAIAHHLINGNLFRTLRERRYHVSYLNAFPPIYFANIASGRRLYSAIPLAAVSAGIKLNSLEDLVAGRALSADFTSEGWNTHLGFHDIPVLSPKEAGKRIADIAQAFDLTFFEYWMTDYAGHRQNMTEAIRLLEVIDRVLEGIVTNWDLSQDMLWVTSDHGNIEDLSHRRHTLNPVPLLLIGSHATRKDLSDFRSLSDIYPALLKLFPPKE